MPIRPSAPPAKAEPKCEMALDFHGNIMVTIHTAYAPSDADWKAYLNALGSKDVESVRSIVFTDGGAPSSKQRKELNELLGGRQVRGIVVSNSMAVRGVVTALSWFNPKIKAFAPDEFRQGLRYLEINSTEEAAVWEVIEDVLSRLSTQDLRSVPKIPGR